MKATVILSQSMAYHTLQYISGPGKLICFLHTLQICTALDSFDYTNFCGYF